ncbi:hypothetical protein B0H13DRAFT_2066869 [Mycena leptocephala]|nr:hypothetical protein B0H13DRAFT_2066869 [Mycena leptocephala]
MRRYGIGQQPGTPLRAWVELLADVHRAVRQHHLHVLRGDARCDALCHTRGDIGGEDEANLSGAEVSGTVLEEPGAQSGALRAFDMFLRWLGRFSGLKRALFALGAMLAKEICAACPRDQPDTGRRLCWNGSGTGNIDVAMPMQGKTQDSVSSTVVP